MNRLALSTTSWIVGAVRVRVAIRRLAALAAHKLVHRHAGLAALDVPQRLVHAADGVVQHRPVLPVGAVVAGLPDVLDAVRGLAEQQRLEVLLHGGTHQVGALREGGAAVAVEAVLVGRDLDHREPHAGGRALDHADVLDLGRGIPRVARAACSWAFCSRGPARPNSPAVPMA